MVKTYSELLTLDAVHIARELVGWTFLVTEEDGTQTGGTIIETEAYSQNDAASHSFKGETQRTKIMFGPPGYLYVYFTYGMHWCANIVTGPTGQGEAVLIRAIRPELGIDTMRERRGNKSDDQLVNGPAKFCQALHITGADNGMKLNESRFSILPPTGSKPKLVATKRIGISHDTDRLWRFVVAEV